MKTVQTKSIKVVSRTLEITKRPKQKNLAGRKVSISFKERDAIQENDTVLLKVYNPEEELIAEKTYTAKQFKRSLVEMEKRVGYAGHTRIRFFTLEY